MHSEQLNELATALSKAQAEFGAVPKGSTNPFFKSKYADLASVVATAAPIVTQNQLSVAQFPGSDERGDTLTTWLMHSSGQFIAQTMRLHLSKDDAQAQGSAMTYARRYSYMAVLGLVADVDDDGNAASKPKNQAPEKPAAPQPAPQAALIHPALMKELREALRAADILGDAASQFVQATLGYPTPRTNEDAQKLIDALKALTPSNDIDLTGNPLADL